MASTEPIESEAPEPKKECLIISMSELWARCNSRDAQALFALARILCNDLEVIGEHAIKTDLSSAYYLAQTALLLAKSQALKKQIEDFIRNKNLTAGSCQIFPNLGLPYGDIHGALSARTLYDKIYAERQTPENTSQQNEKAFPQRATDSTPPRREMNVPGREQSSNRLNPPPAYNGSASAPFPEIEMDILNSQDSLGVQRRSGRVLEPPEEPKNGGAIQFVKDNPAPFIIVGVAFLIGVALVTPFVGPAVLAGLLTVGIGIKMGAVIGGMAIANHAIGSAMIGVGVLAIIACGSIGFFGGKTSEEEVNDRPPHPDPDPIRDPTL